MFKRGSRGRAPGGTCSAFVPRPRPRSFSAQSTPFFPNDPPAASNIHSPVSGWPDGDPGTHWPRRRRETAGEGSPGAPRAPATAATPRVPTGPVSTPPQGPRERPALSAWRTPARGSGEAPARPVRLPVRS